MQVKGLEPQRTQRITKERPRLTRQRLRLTVPAFQPWSGARMQPTAPAVG